RRALLSLLDRHEVSVVASGHLHKAHIDRRNATRFVWGPSGGFVCGPKAQPPMPGRAVLGAVVYDFTPEDVAIRQVEIDDLHPYVMDEGIHEVYPPRQAE